MMGDEDDDPFVEDPSELVSSVEYIHMDHQILATEGWGEHELSFKDNRSCWTAIKV